MQFYVFAEGTFIIAADPGQRALLGAQVLRIGLRFSDKSTRQVTLAADASAPDIWGGIPASWVRFPETLRSPLLLYLENRQSPYWFKYLPDDVLYFQWNGVRNAADEDFNAFVQRLMKFIDDHEVKKDVLRRPEHGHTDRERDECDSRR